MRREDMSVTLMECPQILVLGGTGAIGSFLVPVLSKKYDVFVTSRTERDSTDNITFIKGNAHDLIFLSELLKGKHYYSIIDFMHYSTNEFGKRYLMLLDATDHYFYISSSRVYANYNGKITEDTLRLLDVSDDKEFLKTDDYALAKARQEDILRKSGRNNWTIIRPYMTYSPYRLDLGFYPKELWLYRVLKGRSILFPNNVASNFTTLTFGLDVANTIAGLVGETNTCGETYNITSNTSHTWSEVVYAYKSAIELYGYNVTIKYIERPLITTEYIYRYDRAFNRTFDNSKIRNYIDTSAFTDALDGLRLCVSKFLENPIFGKINWIDQAFWDRELKEFTPLDEIIQVKSKIIYLICRYIIPPPIYSLIRSFAKKIINNLK